MAKRITEYTNIETIAESDVLPIVDVSDTEQATTGSTRKGTVGKIADYIKDRAETLTNKTIDGDDNTVQDLPYSAIKSTSRSGLDEKIITGTPNTTNLGLVQWNSDGDAVDSLVKPAAVSAGWIDFPFGTTCTYVGADDPTYTMYVSGDASSFLSIGMKFECFQSGMKFFFITAIGAYDSGNDRTLVTLYGGTDYDLANSAISANAYSMMKSPQGFPMSPAKWSVIVRSSTDRQTTSTSYASLTDSITIPIGVWDFNYKVSVRLLTSETGGVLAYTSMTSSGTTETNPDLTVWMTRAFSAGMSHTGSTMFARQVLTATSKTVYTLIGKTSAGTVLAGGSTFTPTVFTATCAYL